MAGKRNYEWPLATEWDAAAFLTQDKSGGVTQRVSPALVETKLEADGFPKIPSPSANEVAVYGVGGWDSAKLADANIDAAAAIGWGKISKTGAVATDVGALPSLTISGDVDANSINSGAPCIVKFQSVTSWTNFPFANALLMSGKGGVFTQLAGKDSGISQCWTDLTDGGTYRRNYVTTYGWSPWYTDWDSYNLPAGTTGKALLAAASQAAARSAISALPIANPTATGTLTAPDVVVSNLAGAGTRPAALDSTGKIVVGSANIRTFGTASASFTYSASTPSVVRTTGAIYVTLPAAADFSGSETVFFQEAVGGNSLGFTGQTFESSVSSGSWVTHASGYGWSVAWRKIILSCDGITWYVVVQ